MGRQGGTGELGQCFLCSSSARRCVDGSDDMQYESWFDTHENKTLLAICARKLISNIGIGAIIWGSVNTLLGIVAILVTIINSGILVLGLIMLVTGIQALKKPTLHALYKATIVSILLFFWNLGISFFNLYIAGSFNPQGLVFPVVIAIIFFREYQKLQHVKDHISKVQPKDIEAAKNICKALLKKKLKNEPSIVQTKDRRCRAQLMTDKAFFIQRNMMRSFIVPKDQFPSLLAKPEARTFKIVIKHPLGKLRYSFNKKNSAKIKAWLSSSVSGQDS